MSTDRRWEALFADLEARAAAEEAATQAAEVADRTRAELRRVTLAGRLHAAVQHGAPLRLLLLGGERVTGRAVDAGADWVLLAEPTGREALVPLAAVATCEGLGRQVREPGEVDRRRVLGQALRAVARDRSPVALVLVDATRLAETMDAVGADALDLAVHPVGEVRRRGAVQGVATVPLVQLALVRRQGETS